MDPTEPQTVPPAAPAPAAGGGGKNKKKKKKQAAGQQAAGQQAAGQQAAGVSGAEASVPSESPAPITPESSPAESQGSGEKEEGKEEIASSESAQAAEGKKKKKKKKKGGQAGTVANAGGASGSGAVANSGDIVYEQTSRLLGNWKVRESEEFFEVLSHNPFSLLLPQVANTYGQTMPPSIPVSVLFKGKPYPVGEISEYAGSNQWRTTSEEKKHLERIHQATLYQGDPPSLPLILSSDPPYRCPKGV